MKLSVLKAKIKRNNIEVYAKHYFRDYDSLIIKDLNQQGKQALFGIQREDNIYTIIGENFIYYSTVSGVIRQITLQLFSKILQKKAIEIGKEGNFEFINVAEKEDLIWLHNKETMSAIWNIIIWLEGLLPLPEE